MLNALLVKFGLEGIMGYFRRISDANIGKRQEMKERVYFNQKKAMEKIDKVK